MPSQNEVALLRDQITGEVNSTAEILGNQLFGQAADKREPDVSRVSEAQLQATYRQKFLDQDREWLGNEATRDPQQFMRVAQAIGVVLPKQLSDNVQPIQTNPLGAAAKQEVPVPSLAPVPALQAPMTVPTPPVQPLLPAPGAVPVDPALVQAAITAAAQQQAQPPISPLGP
jgi:hypothetical protein